MFNEFEILIARNVTADATTFSNIDNGELVIVKRDNTFMSPGDTISDSEAFYIVQGTSSTTTAFPISNEIQGRNVRVWKGTAYAAPAEQVSYVGYNGTTGAIDVQDNTEYRLTLEFTQNLDFDQERQRFVRYYFTTGTSATQDQISNAFVAAVNNDPWASQFVIAAEMTSGANRGIRFTGLAQTHSPYANYSQVRFEVTWYQSNVGTTATPIDEFGYFVGTTTAGASNGPSQGVGTYDLVLDKERIGKGWRGFTNRKQFPVLEPPTYAVSGETYDMYVIESDITIDSNMAGVPHTTSKHTLFLAIPTGANSVQTYIEGCLNGYMASTPKQLPPVSL